MSSPTAVDDNICSGKKAGLRRADVEEALGDFLDVTPAADGKFGDKLLVEFGIVQDGEVHLGGARAWADAVDGDALGSEFERERFGEAKQAGFAR